MTIRICSSLSHVDTHINTSVRLLGRATLDGRRIDFIVYVMRVFMYVFWRRACESHFWATSVQGDQKPSAGARAHNIEETAATTASAAVGEMKKNYVFLGYAEVRTFVHQIASCTVRIHCGVEAKTLPIRGT